MKKKIVVVDDETSLLDLLEYALKREGYDVVVCDNGRDALDTIIKAKPDLVLLDIMLPGVDGCAIADKMSGNADIANTPFIVLSALVSAKTMFVSQSHCVGFISKPFDTMELVSKIKEIVGESK